MDGASVRDLPAASAALLIGGGLGISEAMIFAMIRDVTNYKWRTVFFAVTICLTNMAEPLGTLLANSSMRNYGQQTPLWIAVVFIGIGLFLTTLSPETFLPERARRNQQVLLPERRDRVTCKSLLHNFSESFRTFCNYLRATPGMRAMIIALVVTHALADASVAIMPQYIQARYGQPTSALDQLHVIRACETAFVSLVLVPIIDHVWCGNDLPVRDMLGASLFMGFFPWGMILTGVGPILNASMAGVVLMTVGLPFMALLRSLMTRMVRKKHLGAFFCLLAVIEQLTSLAFGLILGGLFEAGKAKMDKSPFWLGLPFLFCATLNFMTWGVFIAFQPKRTSWPGMRFTDEGQDVVLQNLGHL